MTVVYCATWGFSPTQLKNCDATTAAAAAAALAAGCGSDLLGYSSGGVIASIVRGGLFCSPSIACHRGFFPCHYVYFVEGFFRINFLSAVQVKRAAARVWYY